MQKPPCPTPAFLWLPLLPAASNGPTDLTFHMLVNLSKVSPSLDTLLMLMGGSLLSPGAQLQACPITDSSPSGPHSSISESHIPTHTAITLSPPLEVSSFKPYLTSPPQPALQLLPSDLWSLLWSHHCSAQNNLKRAPFPQKPHCSSCPH